MIPTGRRRPSTLLSAASLVLCVATCAVWVWAASRVPGGRPLVFPAEPLADGTFLRLDPSGVTVLRTPGITHALQRTGRAERSL